jgi:hypothetical protein
MTDPLAPGYLAEHPLPSGITGALGLGGYQLLADVGGVGAGRLGRQAFLLVAPDPDPAVPDPGTQIALHHTRLRDEAEAAAYVSLAAQLGYLRMTGYRLALERHGLRSRIRLVNPATGGVAAEISDKHPGGMFSRGSGAAQLLAASRVLPPAGPPPDTSTPELMRGVLLALALADDSVSGAEAADLAARALPLTTGDARMDPRAAIEAARTQA